MMPSFPVTNLVVPQAGFAFAALETLFDPMLRFRRTSEFREFRLGRRIG